MNVPRVTDSEARLLHHTLGVSDAYNPERAPYRNHFVAGPGHPDLKDLENLVAMGHMVCYKHPLTNGDELVFSATDTGKAVAIRTRPRAPKNKLRYHRFLSLKDAIPDLTFKKFLTDPQFRRYRIS